MLIEPEDKQKIVDLASNASTTDQRSFSYYEKHYNELKGIHGGKIVAIVGDIVVASIQIDAEKHELQDFVDDIRDNFGEGAFIAHIPEPDKPLVI